MLHYEQVTSKVRLLPPSLLQDVELFIDRLINCCHQQTQKQTQTNLVVDSAIMTKIAAAGGVIEWLNDPQEDSLVEPYSIPK